MGSSAKLNVLTWNCNSIKNKQCELSQIILDFKLDIVCVCETKINARYSFTVAGFNVYRSDKTSAGGGVALLIHKRYVQNIIKLPNLKNLEAAAAQINTNMGTITIISAYIPPNKKLTFKDLDTVFKISNNIILLGDLNSKQGTWSNSAENYNGNFLLNYCNTNNLNTHYPSNINFSPSTIDLIITKNVNKINKPVSLSILNSNHNPVFTQLDFSAANIVKNVLINYNNVNWKTYKNEINCKIHLMK